MATYEYSESEETYESYEPAEPKKKVGGYRFLSILFLLLAVGGLFLGALSTKLSFLMPFYRYRSEGVLSGSLVGYALSLFKNGTLTSIFGALKSPSTLGYETVINLASVIFLALAFLAALISLITLIISLIMRKAAKNCAMLSGILTFFAYGGLFLIAYVSMCDRLGFGKVMFDIPTAIISGIALFALLFTAIARSKVMGLVTVFMTLFTLGTLFALTFPSASGEAYPSRYIGTLRQSSSFLSKFGTEKFAVISLAALLVLIGFNLFFCIIRLNAKRGFGFDAFRFALMFVATVCVVVAFCVPPISATGSLFGLKKNLLPTAMLLAVSLAAFVLAIAVAVTNKRRMKLAQSETDTETTYEYDEEEEEEEEEEIHRIIINERKKAAATAATATPAPVYEQAPAPAPTPAPAPAPAPAEPVTSSTVSNSTSSSETIRETIRIIEQAAPAPAPAPTPEPVREPTEFEREMAAVARNRSSYSSRTQERTSTEYSAQRLSGEQRTGFVTAPIRQNGMASVKTVQNSSSFDTSYTYDPFLNTLTAQERAEFGDLFISSKFGMQYYLPKYVIGGNNEVFFNKVFIFLGRFRTIISAELLEKLNNYVSMFRQAK